MNTNNQDFALTRMVGIYERPSRDSEMRSDDIRQEFYLESFPAIHTETGITLGAGTPLVKNDFNKMIDFFTNQRNERKRKSRDRMLVGSPGRMLYCDQRFGFEHYVWVVPSKRRTLLFAKECKIGDGQMITPTLIFSAVGTKSLAVIAVKGEVVDNATPLFHAPFLNIYGDSKVCLGTISTGIIAQAKTFEDYMEGWENLFFGSKFSHGVASTKASIRKLTIAAIKKQGKIPEKELLPVTKADGDKKAPIPLTWGDVLKGLMKAAPGSDMSDDIEDYDDN